MWLSQGDPFRFFDEDIGMKLRQWDMMELHAILEHRKKVGYNTPSFIKWVNTSAEENVKIFFINEIRLYNETDSAPILAKQINARSTEIRGEAIRTLGKLKYKEIEPKLIEMYHVQPEEVKRQIISCYCWELRSVSLALPRLSFMGCWSVWTLPFKIRVCILVFVLRA